MMEKDRVDKAQEGDPGSVDEMLAGTWEPLYRFIYYRVQNREETEDILQETYVKALSYLRRADIEIESYIGYLKTVSHNILRDRWRRNKRRGASVNIEGINPEETAAEDLTEESVRRESVIRALNSLSEEQRSVIELRILKGYSAAETARMMNKSEGAVRVLQYRALRTLRIILEEDDRTLER